MILKPFRQFDENDVINMYSLTENSGNAGNLVEIVSWNPAADEGFGGNLSPYAGLMIPRYERLAKIKLATSGSEKKVLGMMLWNVRESDDLGRPLIYTKQRYYELHTVISGETLPVMTRGMVYISGFTGNPAPNSGIGVDNAGGGNWKVIGLDDTPTLGRFLSTTGVDGHAYAFLKV